MIVERLEQARERIGKVLEADDIARAVLYVVSQPQHVSVTR
jgi:NADP-dependent 3-hydroxy acid dehydrogenase YdfG